MRPGPGPGHYHITLSVPSKELIQTLLPPSLKTNQIIWPAYLSSDFVMLFLNIGNYSSEHLNHWDSWRADLVSKLEYKGGMTKIVKAVKQEHLEIIISISTWLPPTHRGSELASTATVWFYFEKGRELSIQFKRREIRGS